MLRDGLAQLIALMQEWVAILDEVVRREIMEEESAAALHFDRARIEGLAMACLCSTSEGVRVRALECLAAASLLDEALLTCRARASGMALRLSKRRLPGQRLRCTCMPLAACSWLSLLPDQCRNVREKTSCTVTLVR